MRARNVPSAFIVARPAWAAAFLRKARVVSFRCCLPAARCGWIRWRLFATSRDALKALCVRLLYMPYVHLTQYPVATTGVGQYSATDPRMESVPGLLHPAQV